MKGNLLKLIFSIIFTIIFSLILVNFLLAEEDQSFPQSESTITTSTENATTTSTESTTTILTDQTATTTSTIESSTTTETLSTTTTSTETLIEENQESTEENMEEETPEESIETPPAQIQQESPPPLKQRKLNKEIKIDFSTSYSCRARNFSIDISNKDQVAFEIELLGEKPKNSTLEIGNLPAGIDITFLNNANYTWNPNQNDSTAILQIIKQPNAEKGNFNIVILYTDNNTQKSSICQVNIVNL